MRQIVLETNDVTLWWREEGFWHYRTNAYREVDGKKVSAFFDAIAAHRAGQKAPLLIDRTYEYNAQFSAWVQFQRRAPALITVVAFYAPSPGAVMAAEYLRDTFLEGWTVRIFRVLAEAEAWLQEHRDFVASGSTMRPRS